jgi:hypothetical protein
MVHYVVPEKVIAAVDTGGLDTDAPVASIRQQTEGYQQFDADPALI